MASAKDSRGNKKFDLYGLSVGLCFIPSFEAYCKSPMSVLLIGVWYVRVSNLTVTP